MKKITFLLALLLLLGCEKEESIHPIKSTILIEPTEVSIGSEKRIFLSCATEMIYTCSNFNIMTSQQVQNNLLQINFSGIDGIKYCASAVGPARAEIDLGALANGDYVLELNSKTFRNTGSLKVTNTEIILSFQQPQGIAISNPVFKR